MDQWEVVEVGFDNADETINFGARTTADESLHETRTLATITSDKQVPGVPKVCCFSCCGKIYAAIDNTFRIFSNECSNVELLLPLSSCVDCLAVSQDERFIVLCLSDGTLQCIDAAGGTLLLNSKYVQ